MSVLPTTQRSSLRIEITCISGVDGSFCEKEGSVSALSRDPPAMASVIPTLNVATLWRRMLELAPVLYVGPGGAAG